MCATSLKRENNPMNCENCQTVLPAGKTFCPNCGHYNSYAPTSGAKDISPQVKPIKEVNRLQHIGLLPLICFVIIGFSVSQVVDSLLYTNARWGITVGVWLISIGGLSFLLTPISAWMATSLRKISATPILLILGASFSTGGIFLQNVYGFGMAILSVPLVYVGTAFIMSVGIRAGVAKIFNYISGLLLGFSISLLLHFLPGYIYPGILMGILSILMIVYFFFIDPAYLADLGKRRDSGLYTYLILFIFWFILIVLSLIKYFLNRQLNLPIW
jgi:hypothetical protein